MAVVFQFKTGEGSPSSSLLPGEPAFDKQNNILYIGDKNGCPVNIVDGLAEKAITLEGYGITDAYTKDEINNKLASVYKYKGSVKYYFELPEVNDIGDDGIVGINGSPAPNPKNPKIIPIRAVAHIPKNTHAGTFCT